MASLTERLGFGPDARVAVVHVDDIGMCHDGNVGAFEALEAGPATCGSVMMPCPWATEAAARARQRPEIDLGVHLTLNSEWEGYRWGPVAGRSAVPSLLDDEGFLPRTTREALARASPEQVEVELRAQVEQALAAGIDVTHLDAHMGTAFFPPFTEIYARLALHYRLPVLAVRPDADLLRERSLDEAAPAFARLADTLETAGIPVLDAVDTDSPRFAAQGGLPHQRQRLARLRPGVTYLICHAARGGEELTAIAPHQARQRDFERRFYGGGAGRRAFVEAGIETIGMRALRKLVRETK